jgi:sigma-E factor negative regulatory protein RseA
MSEQFDGPLSERVNAELISCLIDGELDRGEAEALLRGVCDDADLRARWEQMHLVGDALRSSEVAACHAGSFCRRVAAALASEPTVLAPRKAPERSQARRWIVPGVAVAASVAALGWVALPMLAPPPSVTLATAPAASPAPAAAEQPQPQPVTSRRSVPAMNASLDVYLSAHRELTGGTAMPRAAHYLRVNNGEDR